MDNTKIWRVEKMEFIHNDSEIDESKANEDDENENE